MICNLLKYSAIENVGQYGIVSSLRYEWYHEVGVGLGVSVGVIRGCECEWGRKKFSPGGEPGLFYCTVRGGYQFFITMVFI